MEIGKKICGIAHTHKLGDFKIGDIALHPNNGYTIISSLPHIEFANENDYRRIYIHVVSNEPIEEGDYIIEHDQVFGPVEKGDVISLENSKKIIASTDLELGLSNIPNLFLRRLVKSGWATKHVVVDIIKLYNDGCGWKPSLLPSEWNDSVQTKEVVYEDTEGYIKIEIPNNIFSVEDMLDAYREFAMCGDSDRPKDEKEVEEMFKKFLIKKMYEDE